MKVPFFSMSEKVSRERESLHQALDRVLDSKSFVLGAEVAAFEKELAEIAGLKPELAVSCNSGTDAIVLGLRALGVEAGDEVLLPSHTAVPTATAVRMLGAIPRFADIDPHTWVLSANDALSQITPKTKAIIGVHLYGNSIDLSAFSEVKHLLLEDVAQAQGGFFKKIPLGTWARCGALSFYPTKNLGALGDGGAVYCKDPADAALVRSLRFYGQSSRYKAELDHGMNSRLDELQAAFLRIRLPKMQDDLNRKTKLRKLYEGALAGLPISLQRTTSGCEPAWHLMVVAFESEKMKEKVAASLAANGIGALVHYPVPNHLQNAFREFKTRALPVTEDLCSRILSLPFHPELSDQNVQLVSDCIRGALD